MGEKLINSAMPLVSCVMVTNGRVPLLEKSVQCYLKQTYSNRNLVVLSQAIPSCNVLIQNFLGSLRRADIEFFVVPEDLSLGMMRNTSVELAKGEIICQWDDDDLYHPERIKSQQRVLRSDSRHVASAYCEFLKYFANDHNLYWCDWSGEPIKSHRYLCGSVMFYKEAFFRFPVLYPQEGPQSVVEEDLNVLEKLLCIGDVGMVRSGNEYTYVYHGQNTYGLGHHKLTLNTTWGKKLMEPAILRDRKQVIEETLRTVGFTGVAHVASEEEACYSLTI